MQNGNIVNLNNWYGPKISDVIKSWTVAHAFTHPTIHNQTTPEEYTTTPVQHSQTFFALASLKKTLKNPTQRQWVHADNHSALGSVHARI